MRRLKIHFVVAFVIYTYLMPGISFAQPIAFANKRIVFLGNSITLAGTYVNDVETYLRVQYPGRKLEIINVGLPSETVSGLSEPGHADGKFPRPNLHERLAKVLEQTKPDLVFACYGMKNCIYMPFDTSRFQKFKEGINWLHDQVVETGARLIYLTPPDYDEVKGKSIGYTNVLDRYADWILSRRCLSNWEVIDIHYPMKKYLQVHRKIDSTFALAPDGVHPSEAGHWIIAKQILLYLGWKKIAQSPCIIESLRSIPDAIALINLVSKRQYLLRDAWLSATKHLHPGLPVGLPLIEAQAKADELLQEIVAIIQKK